MTDSTPPTRLGPIAGIVLTAVAIPSLALNQVLFVGTFAGWMAYGALAILSLLALAAMRPQSLSYPVALLLIGATLVSPEALPYSFGVLFFASAIVFAQTGGTRGEKSINHAITILGVWAAYLLVRWWIGPVTAAEELRENLHVIAGQAWLPASPPPPPNQPLGHANYTAGLGVLLLPVFIWRAITAEHRAGRMLWGLFSAIPSALILTVGSRAALLAPGVAVVFWVALAPASRLSSKRKRHIAVTMLLASIAVMLLHPRFHNWLNSASTQTDSDLVRRDYLVGCWNMFLDRPFTGQGAGSIPLHFPKFAPPDAEQFGCYHAHCTPIQWMAEFGIGGLALFVIILWATLKSLRSSHELANRTRATGFALGAAAYLVFSLFDYQTNNPLLGTTWGIVLGFCLKFIPNRIEFTARIPQLLKICTAIATAILCWRIADTAPARWHVREAHRQLEHDYPAAIVHILQATQASPDEPAIHAIAAMLLSDADRHGHAAKQPALQELADQHWRLADELAPDLPKIKTHRALAAMNHRPSEAEALLRESLALSPRQPAAWVALARLTAMRGDTEETTQVLALSLLCHPEYYTAPFVRMERYGVAPAAIKARFDHLTAAYAQESPEDKRAARIFARSREHFDAWDKAGNVPVKVSFNEEPTPEQTLLLNAGNDREKGVRALRAIVMRRHQVDPEDRPAATLLSQYHGTPDTAPFAGARTLHSEETWGGFGAYTGFADFISLKSGFLRDEDLLRGTTGWADPIRSSRAQREFFAARLRHPTPNPAHP